MHTVAHDSSWRGCPPTSTHPAPREVWTIAQVDNPGTPVQHSVPLRRPSWICGAGPLGLEKVMAGRDAPDTVAMTGRRLSSEAARTGARIFSGERVPPNGRGLGLSRGSYAQK
jgi:hypothetical protein